MKNHTLLNNYDPFPLPVELELAATSSSSSSAAEPWSVGGPVRIYGAKSDEQEEEEVGNCNCE